MNGIIEAGFNKIMHSFEFLDMKELILCNSEMTSDLGRV